MTDYLELFKIERASLELAIPEEVGDIQDRMHQGKIRWANSSQRNSSLIEPLTCLLVVENMLMRELWSDYDVLVAEREVSTKKYRATIKVTAGIPCIFIALYKVRDIEPTLYFYERGGVSDEISRLYEFLDVKRNRDRLQIVWELYVVLRSLYGDVDKLRTSAAQKSGLLKEAFGRILERVIEEVEGIAGQYKYIHSFANANLAAAIVNAISQEVAEVVHYNTLLRRPLGNLGEFPVVVTEYGAYVCNFNHITDSKDVEQWQVLYDALVTTWHRVKAARNEASEAIAAKAREYPKSAALLARAIDRRNIPLTGNHYPTPEATCLFSGLRGLLKRVNDLVCSAKSAVGMLSEICVAYEIEYVPNNLAAAMLACFPNTDISLRLAMSASDEELAEAIVALDEHSRRLVAIPDKRYKLQVKQQPAPSLYADPL